MDVPGPDDGRPPMPESGLGTTSICPNCYHPIAVINIVMPLDGPA